MHYEVTLRHSECRETVMFYDLLSESSITTLERWLERTQFSTENILETGVLTFVVQN